jgi:hypothetical protein
MWSCPCGNESTVSGDIFVLTPKKPVLHPFCTVRLPGAIRSFITLMALPSQGPGKNPSPWPGPVLPGTKFFCGSGFFLRRLVMFSWRSDKYWRWGIGLSEVSQAEPSWSLLSQDGFKNRLSGRRVFGRSDVCKCVRSFFLYRFMCVAPMAGDFPRSGKPRSPRRRRRVVLCVVLCLKCIWLHLSDQFKMCFA